MNLRILYLFLLLININLLANATQISISYEKPKNKADYDLRKLIIDSKVNEDFVDLINSTFTLSKKAKIVYGYNDGPLYDMEKNTIFIPYDFIDEVYIRFEKVFKEDVSDKVFDSLIHTLFHEFAHLLIFVENIPVIGKEEDAADNLATLLLIEYFDDGARIAQNSAELFLLESKDVKKLTKENYWGEHSLDMQRYYSILCNIYGSDEKKHSYLAKKLKYDDYRKDVCISEYESIYNSWMNLLEPILKK